MRVKLNRPYRQPGRLWNKGEIMTEEYIPTVILRALVRYGSGELLPEPEPEAEVIEEAPAPEPEPEPTHDIAESAMIAPPETAMRPPAQPRRKRRHKKSAPPDQY